MRKTIVVSHDEGKGGLDRDDDVIKPRIVEQSLKEKDRRSGP